VKVVVPIKQAAALAEEYEPPSGAVEVPTSALSWRLSDWDACALEAAVQLREGGGEVVVVSVGGDEAVEGLRAGLAKGADRAIHVQGDRLDRDDAMAMGRVLAAVVEREGADLVLCGAQSADAANGATPAALAGYLDFTHVAVVRTLLEHDPSSGTIEVERELEGGLWERLRLRRPALLSIQTGLSEPRHATLREIKLAARQPIERLDLLALGLGEDPASLAGARRRSLSTPPRGAGAELLTGEPDDVARRILALVQERLAT
jgi:electron transfer flavoprotein beta subunit